MMEELQKVICNHKYEVISVNLTNSMAKEKCSDCGRIRRRDVAKIDSDQEDT